MFLIYLQTIETEGNTHHDNGLSANHNASPSKNSILGKPASIPKYSNKENNKFGKKSNKDASKSDKPVKVVKDKERKRKHKNQDVDEVQRLKKKLKATESNLAQSLETIESYRALTVK